MSYIITVYLIGMLASAPLNYLLLEEYHRQRLKLSEIAVLRGVLISALIWPALWYLAMSDSVKKICLRFRAAGEKPFAEGELEELCRNLPSISDMWPTEYEETKPKPKRKVRKKTTGKGGRKRK